MAHALYLRTEKPGPGVWTPVRFQPPAHDAARPSYNPPKHPQGKYLSLGTLRTSRDWITASVMLAVLAAAVGGNSAYKSVNTARTDVRRKKALAALEKDN